MSRRHSSLSPVISPQRLSISSESSITTHRNIGYKPIGLSKKTFIDIHRIDIPSTTSSKLSPSLLPNTAERLLIHCLDGMPSVFPLSMSITWATADLEHVLATKGTLSDIP